jgi:sec-independent protein translocase protein TatB
MFDFAWSEIALIGVVALIAIGPKDMPVAIKAVTNAIKKARRMAAEFQTHVDEMMREADLDEVRKQVNQIRNFDFKGEVERAVDPDHSLRTTFASNPLAADPPKAAVAAFPEPEPVEQHAAAALGSPATDGAPELPALAELRADVTAELAADAAADHDDAPAFIPPEFAAPPEPPPAFVPPAATKQAVSASRY